MTHEHVKLEIVGGGPFDGQTLEVPVLRPDIIIHHTAPLAHFGIPVRKLPDGRLVVDWNDIKRGPRHP